MRLLLEPSRCRSTSTSRWQLAGGLGPLLGLWTRAAPAGGVVLPLTLYLTVSFHTSPYYTGADIVFLFAWIPHLQAGSDGVRSLDG